MICPAAICPTSSAEAITNYTSDIAGTHPRGDSRLTYPMTYSIATTMKVSPRPNLSSAKQKVVTYTSASLAIKGFPIAIIIAWAVVIVPATECSETADVLTR